MARRVTSRLNALEVKKLASLTVTKAEMVADGGGLYLRLRPGGVPSWVFVTTVGGRRREIGLGGVASRTLAEAREAAADARAAMRDGRDPATAVKRAPTESPTASPDAPTFGDWADEFVGNLKGGWKNAKHRQQWENTLQTHAKPLRRMKVDAIGTDDVLGVLRPIWKDANETASRLRGRIERILDAARAKGHIRPPYENPARWRGHLEHFLPRRRKGEKDHHAAVPWQEMPDFFAVLRKRRNSPSVLALQFTILTAARTSEVIEATWREFNLAERTWTVPGDRMKMSLEHTVPLTDAALAILKIMGAGGMARDGYVFPGLRAGKGLSNMAMLKLLQVDMGREETVHGFRSSFRDWAGDGTDFPRELAEMALAHAIGDKAEAAYRRGRAVEKRRPLMESWAGHLGVAEPPAITFKPGDGSTEADWDGVSNEHALTLEENVAGQIVHRDSSELAESVKRGRRSA